MLNHLAQVLGQSHSNRFWFAEPYHDNHAKKGSTSKGLGCETSEVDYREYGDLSRTITLTHWFMSTNENAQNQTLSNSWLECCLIRKMQLHFIISLSFRSFSSRLQSSFGMKPPNHCQRAGNLLRFLWLRDEVGICRNRKSITCIEPKIIEQTIFMTLFFPAMMVIIYSLLL